MNIDCMGDLQAWSLEPNGALTDERQVPFPSPDPISLSIGDNCWRRAESIAAEIIGQVQPTVVSEQRRKAVIGCVQRLIRNCLGCEVFPFGSVPLKTYLPDGDIDLTAFGNGAFGEDTLAKDVFSVLEAEDKNPASEFVVKDVQYIRAEVKLVKCLVQNIVVDVSFNQLGGLCTLCFLEQVDRLIGKGNLFKRSIILIKAWCYYESRILGAHHGLISTYGLETLVLYIFHLFHSSLDGPLAVLYKFLDYFSKFDWDNYCISLNGPVQISSLPEIIAETPENGGADLLLSADFLRHCVDMFSVPSRGIETNSRIFMQKHLNIIDPLKENNNLGRSVSKGNFYRIRSAFTYGARKLAQILLEPEESIGDELRKFFSNTLDRHENGHRLDVQGPLPNRFVPESSYLGTETFQEDKTVPEFELSDSNIINGDSRFGPDSSLCDQFRNIEVLGSEGEPQLVSEKVGPSSFSVSDGTCLTGETKDLATSKIQTPKLTNDAPKVSSPSGNKSDSSSICNAQHLFFSHPLRENAKFRTVDSKGKPPRNSDICGMSPKPLRKLEEQTHTIGLKGENYGAVNLALDLSGDFESQLSSLHYGRWCYEYTLSFPVPPSPPFLSPVQSKSSWDLVNRSAPFRGNVFPNMDVNGGVPSAARPFYPMNQIPPIVTGENVGIEEPPRSRGLGTYFPNTNHFSYRDRHSSGRGRYQLMVRSPRSSIQNPLDSHHLGPAPPVTVSDATASGHKLPPDGVIEFGSYGQPPARGVDFPEGSRQLNAGSPVLPQSIEMQRPTPVLERIAVKPYYLKDEDDFPPLSL